jgi:2-polyprenyl-3-methyl-5-hydroxy-6-metoxy-1,4-benzoquinol methylase
VLDVGCAARYGRPDWFHGLVCEAVPDVAGIDIDESAISRLRAEGYNVLVADACSFDLGRSFDVVFAGELIEHLDDVRGFLTSARRHLREGGHLVLTTPNAFYVGNFVYRVGGHANVHAEHTCWYCEDTMRQVLSHNGFGHVDIYFTGHVSPTLLRRVATFSSRILLPPRLAMDTLVAVASTGDGS